MPRRALTLSMVFLLALVTRASAQRTGDELIDQLSLEPLRALAGELSDLDLDDPLTPAQYARIVEYRQRTPALVRLGAASDEDLAAIAAALCKAPAGECSFTTTYALRCLADRCEVAIAPPPRVDVLQPSRCQPSVRTHKRSAPLGLGFDWGMGWHRSRYPSDGAAYSFGIEARLRLGRRFGTIARIDRITGRDEGTDADGNGEDDTATGSITRIAALAGPSVVFDHARFEDTMRYLRLELLGGYLSTRSQADESGPAAGFDLAYQISVIRLGVRFVQGFAGASDATMLLTHFGLVTGSAPPEPDDADCNPDGTPRPSRWRRSSSRLAIGFEYQLLGYGLASELGVMATGIGFELAWNLTSRLDAVAHTDLLLYPGCERDRTIHHAALAGIRITHDRRTDDDQVGFFTTVMSGYSHGAGLTPTSTGTGPIGDLALGWGIQSPEGAASLRLHGRFGITPDNVDYRALFLSFGAELRLDPRRWRYRP